MIAAPVNVRPETPNVPRSPDGGPSCPVGSPGALSDEQLAAAIRPFAVRIVNAIAAGGTPGDAADLFCAAVPELMPRIGRDGCAALLDKLPEMIEAGRQKAKTARSPGLTPEDAHDVGRYIAPCDDGTYPGQMHTYYGCTVKEFAERSGLRMTATATGQAWVRPRVTDGAGDAFAADWDKDKHPRGQPDNKGQFAKKGGGGSGAATADRTPKREPTAEPAPGHGRPATVPARTASKGTRAARRYRDTARRRRVIVAVNNEGKLSRAIQGANLPDSEPADVVHLLDPNGRPVTDPAHVKAALRRREWAVARLKRPDLSESDRDQCRRILASPAALIEVKTLLTAKGHTVHMSAAAQKRKARWMKKYAVTFFTVALDQRRGQKHSGHEVHIVHGFAGTVRLDQMERVPNLEAVRGHIESKADEAKTEARRVSGVHFAAASGG
jgi:hypothetical protein